MRSGNVKTSSDVEEPPPSILCDRRRANCPSTLQSLCALVEHKTAQHTRSTTFIPLDTEVYEPLDTCTGMQHHRSLRIPLFRFECYCMESL